MTAWNGAFYAGTEDALWRREGSGGSWVEILPPSAGPARLMASGDHALVVGSNTHIRAMGRDGKFHDRSTGINPLLLTHLWMAEDSLFAGNTIAGYLHQWNAAAEVWQTLPAPLPFRAFAGTGNILMTSSGKISEDGGRTWSTFISAGVGTPQSGFANLIFTNGHFYGGDEKGGVWKYSAFIPEQPAVSITSQGVSTFPGSAPQSQSVWIGFFSKNQEVASRHPDAG